MTPLLSAAMIVRDEAKHLDACLASLEGVADDVVVVDTGSRDATRAIARRRGARVFDFPWRDDFSAARNRSLDLARGRFVLYIDADERVRPTDGRALRRLLRAPDVAGAYVLLHPITGFTPYRELRLFLRDPRIRFEGVIHENIWPSLGAVVSDEGLRLESSDLVLDHVGYDGDQRHKLGRNLSLLERAVRETPDSVYHWCHLAGVYAELGRHARAERTWQRALDLVRARGSRDVRDSVAYVGAVRWRQSRGRPIDRLLAEGLARFPDDLRLHWLHAGRLVERGRFARAIDVVRHVLRRGRRANPDIAWDRGMFGAQAYRALAVCCFRLGRYAESARWVARARAFETTA